MSAANGREGEVEGDQDGLAPTWRHLSFYEASKIRDVSDFAASPAAFRSPNEIAAISKASVHPSFAAAVTQANGYNNGNSASSSTTANRQQSVLVGDIHGQIRVFDAERYSELGSWQAYHGSESGGVSSGRVTHLSCDEEGRVVTLGEDDGARFPVIRIWDLTSTAKSSNGSQPSPRLLTEGKVQHGSRPHPIAAIAHTPSLSFLSIGLADGSVLLLRGLDDVLKAAKSSTVSPAVLLPKFKVALQPSAIKDSLAVQEAVTGLGFAEHLSRSATVVSAKAASKKAMTTGRTRKGPPARKSLASVGFGDSNHRDGEKLEVPDTVNLFIVTLSRILRYTVLGKGAGLPASVVDDVGCALGCAQLVPRGRSTDAINPLEGKMVVARDEAIYIVGAEGREMSLAYEGE